MISSLDSMLFAMIVCGMVLLLVSYCTQSALQEKHYLKENEKMLATQSFSQSLFSKRNVASPELGAAHYDFEKMGTESNVLDEMLLLSAKPHSLGGFVLAGIYEKTPNQKKYFFRENGDNCISLERAAIVKSITERRAVIGVVVCEK